MKDFCPVTLFHGYNIFCDGIHVRPLLSHPHRRILSPLHWVCWVLVLSVGCQTASMCYFNTCYILIIDVHQSFVLKI